MQLTKHFTLAELTHSDTAKSNGVNNVPSDPQIIDNLRLAAEHILEPIRVHFGIPFAPLSGYRGDALERLITWNNGFKRWCNARKLPHNETSWVQYFDKKSHPKGQAFDIKIPGIPTKQLFDWLKSNVQGFDQIIMENYKPSNPMSGWVHASFNKDGNRKQVLEIQE